MRLNYWLRTRRHNVGLWCIVTGFTIVLQQAAWAQETTTPAAQSQYTRERPRDTAGRVTGPTRTGWWNDAVFYQVFVRSFQDSSDPASPLANDGVGDLRGLISRLDYLNDADPATTTDLGITALWLMPIQPSPSYHGYDITDYAAVHPDYGSLDDLRELTRQCHQRGIKVILDLVLNHTSSRHPWFAESLDPASPKQQWYLWRDADPGYRGPWNQRVWHRPSRRVLGQIPPERLAANSQYYYAIFGADMPDLNFTHPAVTDEMLRVVRFWLDRSPTGPAIDGFRLDAIRHLIEADQQQDNTPETHRWLESFYDELKAANPDALAIGEVWASTDVAASYVGDQMDLTFEFDLAQAIIESARTADASHVINAQAAVQRAYPPNQYGRFLTNHDQQRVATTLANHPGKLRTAAAMLLLGPGVPFIYYAEELGQPGSKPDPDLRTPMPWTSTSVGFSAANPWRPPTSAPAQTNVLAQTTDPDSLLSFYRSLIRLRAANPALAHGGFIPVPSSSPAVYAFLRTVPAATPGDPAAVFVVINLSDAKIDTVRLTADAASLDFGVPLHASDALNRGDDVSFTPDAVTGGFTHTIRTLNPHAVCVYVLRPLNK